MNEVNINLRNKTLVDQSLHIESLKRENILLHARLKACLHSHASSNRSKIFVVSKSSRYRLYANTNILYNFCNKRGHVHSSQAFSNQTLFGYQK